MVFFLCPPLALVALCSLRLFCLASNDSSSSSSDVRGKSINERDCKSSTILLLSWHFQGFVLCRLGNPRFGCLASGGFLVVKSCPLLGLASGRGGFGWW